MVYYVHIETEAMDLHLIFRKSFYSAMEVKRLIKRPENWQDAYKVWMLKKYEFLIQISLKRNGILPRAPLNYLCS